MLNNSYNIKTLDNNLDIRCIDEGIFRIRMSCDEEYPESLLSRYNILKEKIKPINSEFTSQDTESILKTDKFLVSVDKISQTVSFHGGNKELVVRLSGKDGGKYNNIGFSVEIALDDKERLFGLGDENRTNIMKRGESAELWQTDYVSYGPIPFLMSSAGWGILVNCTYMHKYDMGKTVPDRLLIDSAKGGIDFYIFIAENMKQVLNLYTDVAGKPVMLPKSAYGFTFVCNEENNARNMLDDCIGFRKSDIPCDIIGLEPGWMEKHYDFSVDKKWSQERFYYPYWEPENYTGVFSFFYNLRKLGYKLSLWLCCDYDLLWEEEKENLKRKSNKMDDRVIKDEHLHYNITMDKITKEGEPWFEHLKKFVDNGAAAFKLDGANQVLEHSDRLWAGKYLDEEVHNVYPVIYAKQMKEGFESYTGRRAFIYTPSSYAGTQQYAATWSGDTGGGPDTLVSVLNLSLSGHTNTSCDLEPTNPKSIHYGFLMPWTQLLGWRNWHQPWYLGEKLENMIRKYSKLRSALFPYIYSMAHLANRTGLPLVRPLCLMYPDKPEYDLIKNSYMFGDSFLVAAFDMNITLPDGQWYDYWNDEIYEGNSSFEYKLTDDIGGALFVKAGSVVVMQKPMSNLDKEFPENYEIHIYPGENCEFNLIEDDGVTYDYEKGEFLSTKMVMEHCYDGKFDFTVHMREGSFSGKKCDIDYDIDTMSENHASNVQNMPPVCSFSVVIHGGEYDVALADSDDAKMQCEFNNNNTCFVIEKSLHEEKTVRYTIEKR